MPRDLLPGDAPRALFAAIGLVTIAAWAGCTVGRRVPPPSPREQARAESLRVAHQTIDSLRAAQVPQRETLRVVRERWLAAITPAAPVTTDVPPARPLTLAQVIDAGEQLRAACDVAIATCEARVAAESTGRVLAESLFADARQRARGCRVPLLGVPCPVLGPSLALIATPDGQLRAGVGVSVTVPLSRP